jgi:hypothetical protein
MISGRNLSYYVVSNHTIFGQFYCREAVPNIGPLTEKEIKVDSGGRDYLPLIREVKGSKYIGDQ